MAGKNGAVAKKILATKTSHLPVQLTSSELAKVAEEMGRVEGDLRAFYGKKKEITSDLKQQEDKLDAEMGRLGRLQRDKKEYRPVPVRVEADYRAGKVYEIREDTGEVVGERPVTEQDKQTTLFGAAPKAEPEAVAGELVWHQVEETHRAEVEAGEYSILPTSGASADWLATWVPRKGASKTLGKHTKLSEAKGACERHHLELRGDELLANAGAGAMNAADLTWCRGCRRSRRIIIFDGKHGPISRRACRSYMSLVQRRCEERAEAKRVRNSTRERLSRVQLAETYLARMLGGRHLQLAALVLQAKRSQVEAKRIISNRRSAA